MSIDVTSAVWKRSASTLADRLVMLYIADRCNEDGSGAYPAVATIAKHAGVSERSVQLSVKRLVAMGELEVLPNAGPHGVNVYRILLDGLGGTPSPRHDQPRNVCTPAHPSPRTSRQTPPHILRLDPAHPSPNTSTDTPTETPTPPLPPKGGVEYSEGFEAFWRAYPRKVEKIAAWRRWQKINGAMPIVADIVASVEAHKRSADWLKNNGEFIPYPATWLNKGGWTSELTSGVVKRDRLVV